MNDDLQNPQKNYLIQAFSGWKAGLTGSLCKEMYCEWNSFIESTQFNPSIYPVRVREPILASSGDGGVHLGQVHHMSDV